MQYALITAALVAVVIASPTSSSTIISEDKNAAIGPFLAGPFDPCSAQSVGYAPITIPDTAKAFTSNIILSGIAIAAKTPNNYVRSFQDLQGATDYGNSNSRSYLGFYYLNSYDVNACSALCDAARSKLSTGCMFFNIYIERDPLLFPATACPNPPSTANYKCSLWNVNSDSSSAINNGQYREQFQVAITGSNGYNFAQI